MRSQFVDKFNHDAEAAGYDQDVLNEQHPVRASYSDLLDWVVTTAQVSATSTIVDLGTGTGNLAKRIRHYKHLECVDASSKMLRIARDKLAGLDNVHFVQSDILEYFDSPRGPWDAVISTYTIHHLVDVEKAYLFDAVSNVLAREGMAVFGDLMFKTEQHRKQYLDQLRQAGKAALAAGIEGEFFWNVERAVDELQELGLSVSVRQFSELSWGISARKNRCA